MAGKNGSQTWSHFNEPSIPNNSFSMDNHFNFTHNVNRDNTGSLKTPLSFFEQPQEIKMENSINSYEQENDLLDHQQQSPLLVWNRIAQLPESGLFRMANDMLSPNGPTLSLKPLSSSSTGDLPSPQIKEEKNAYANANTSDNTDVNVNAMSNCFDPEPHKSQNRMPLSPDRRVASAITNRRRRRLVRQRKVSSISMDTLSITKVNMNQVMDVKPLNESHPYSPTQFQAPRSAASGSQKPKGRSHRGKIEFHENNEKELKGKNLKFLLQKELQNSDVGTLGRIVLPKKESETHLPALSPREGYKYMLMEDIDTSEFWKFKYRFWPNNKSRMYVLENTGEFVKAHKLRRGDYVMLYWDDTREIHVIRARKSSLYRAASSNSGELENGMGFPPPAPQPAKMMIEDLHGNGNENGSVESTTDKDNEVSSKTPYGCDNKMEEATDMDDYIFPKDFVLDFAPGIPNSPRLDSIPSFGSDEISLEDFLND